MIEAQLRSVEYRNVSYVDIGAIYSGYFRGLKHTKCAQSETVSQAHPRRVR